MKKAFTLIELLVVIGILAVLTGIIVASFGGTTDSARAAKCLANMKNLAQAVQSRGAETGYYPYAGSIEYMGMDTSRGRSGAQLVYNEHKGWISWASEGHYPSQSKKGAPPIPMCTEDDQLGMFALTNGALWKYVNGSRSVYVCPLHVKKNKTVRWSYVMNAYFGWNADESYAYTARHSGQQYGDDIKCWNEDAHKYEAVGLDRLLLFSEIPFQGAGEWFPDGASSSTDSDAILQYKGCNKSPNISGKNRKDGDEHIGANHKSGKNWFAHVVFADGHVEKFQANTDKGNMLSSEDLRKLTTWLCTGQAASFNGKEYEKLD